MIKSSSKRSERGQVIILVAGALVGLVAIFGLMIDGGLLLIQYGRLKRGIDAASVAAAAQFRKGYNEQDLINAGAELLHYNQADATVTVQTCDGVGVNHDETLCPTGTQIKRKLVRVTATRTVNFGFLPVIGINSTTITASSVGEAASIDMVMVLDTSSSMAYETVGNPEGPDPAVRNVTAGDDPRACNHSSPRCEPMGTVKDVAAQFIDKLFFPYDRVSVITSTSQTPGVTGAGMRNPTLLTSFNDDSASLQNIINNVIVLEPGACDHGVFDGTADLTSPGPCLLNQPDPNADLFYIDTCFPRQFAGDPTTCGPSNIGGGLVEAGDQFVAARQDAFWVVINLFGGPANATDDSSVFPGAPPNGFCPPSTWALPGFCRDEDPTSSNRHHLVNGVYDPNYDADDFARDAADHVASTKTGQGATIFSICMGNPCQNFNGPSYVDRASGDRLGHYMAEKAGDEYDAFGNLISPANHGLYFYSQSASGLTKIFNAIAASIFTRISQ